MNLGERKYYFFLPASLKRNREGFFFHSLLAFWGASATFAPGVKYL
jgi:hypothetical protein